MHVSVIICSRIRSQFKVVQKNNYLLYIKVLVQRAQLIEIATWCNSIKCKFTSDRVYPQLEMLNVNRAIVLLAVSTRRISLSIKISWALVFFVGRNEQLELFILSILIGINESVRLR